MGATNLICGWNIIRHKGGDPMDWADIVQAISSVGFPIIVAMYSLIRLEKTIHSNTEVLTKLYVRLGKEE